MHLESCIGSTTVVSKQHMTCHRAVYTNVCKYKIIVELMQQKCASSKEHALSALMYAQVAYNFAMLLCVAAPHHACCSGSTATTAAAAVCGVAASALQCDYLIDSL
jgi:hypothetical protein